VARRLRAWLTVAGSSATKAVVPGKVWFCHRVALPGYRVSRTSGRPTSCEKRRSTKGSAPERSTIPNGWWNQIVTSGWIRTINRRAARDSGSESGPVPEYSPPPRCVQS
jgi:hypothetical protein